jgi:hypothetical protein
MVSLFFSYHFSLLSEAATQQTCGSYAYENTDRDLSIREQTKKLLPSAIVDTYEVQTGAGVYKKQSILITSVP